MLKTLFAITLLTSAFDIPLTNPGFTAVYDARKKVVTVKWQHTTKGVKTFIVQRSADKFNWTDIARLENIPARIGTTYQYNDDKAQDNESYYRLKWITATNQIEYSASIMVITGSNKHQWVMYPLPVTTMLTLQYKGKARITGVINIQLHNWDSKILTRFRFASNTTVIKIPVDNLGKGIYDIRIIIEGELIWNQKFVK